MKGSSEVYSLPRRMFFLLVLLTPALAQAHPGLAGHTHGFNNGLIHPLSGWDHILAMTAVGVWAVQGGRRAFWLVPLAFVSVMVLGGLLGMAGLGRIPLIEQGIAASVLILGIFIAASVQLPLRAGALVVGFFAFFHGYAHGAEMPATVSGWLYGLGFVVATSGLHLFGMGLGLTAQRLNSMKLVRCVGAVMAVFGLYLFFSA